MVDTSQSRSEMLAVAGNAADRDAAEADAVIAAFTTDQARAQSVAAHAVIGEGNLQCGVDRFRSVIAKEHAIHALR